MKMDLVPESLPERLLLMAGAIPRSMVMTFAGMTQSRILTTCASLGILEHLVKQPCTPAELARALELDVEATTRLVYCLHSGELVDRQGDRYRIKKRMWKWFDPDADTTMINILKHYDDLWRMWVDLPEVVKHGARRDEYQAMLRQEASERKWGTHDPAQLRRHLMGLRDLARLQARELVLRLRLPKGPGRLLDIGGGHCQHLISLLKARPEYTGVDFDLPMPARIGREVVAKAGMEHRIQVIEGDLFADDLPAKLGTDFTGVLYFNILHNLSEAQNRTVLGQLARATMPGGRIFLWDMYGREGGPISALGAVFSLQMLLGSPGTSFSVPQVTGWLAEAGFHGVKEIPTRSVPGFTVLVATRR